MKSSAFKICCFLAFLSLWTWSVEAKKLPSFIKRCERNDPNLNSCMTNAILNFKKYLPKGMRELKLPPMDPYVLDGSSIKASWMSANFTNLKLYNSYNFDVDYLNVDLENNEIALNLTQKYTEIKCHYRMVGQLLQFALEGEGDVDAEFPNTKTGSIMRGVKVKRNGKEYLDLQTNDFKILSYEHFRFYFHDLFRNNPEMTATINRLFDENRNEFAIEIHPLLENVISQVYMSFFKGVFDTFSLDELFL